MLLRKELLKQRMTARSPIKINTVFFKKWVTATISWTKKITYFKERIVVIKEVK